MEEIIDLIATNSSAIEISDKIKEVLFSKASERVESERPNVASSMFNNVEKSVETGDGV
jgi:hypothetical protein